MQSMRQEFREFFPFHTQQQKQLQQHESVFIQITPILFRSWHIFDPLPLARNFKIFVSSSSAERRR